MALTAAVLAVGPALSPVRAEAVPLRSGTIVGGAGVELAGGEPWEHRAAERSGCEYALDCLPWLQSGCNPALAGHDPVLTASIVDVGDIAGDGATRSLRMATPHIPPWGVFPGVVVQFWRQDCTEIADAKLHSLESSVEGEWGRCLLDIPADARWMTLSGYVTTVRMSWTLA